DRRAFLALKEHHQQHRDASESRMALAIKRNYEAALERSIRSLHDWWEETSNTVQGLSRIQRIASRVCSRIEVYERRADDWRKDLLDRISSFDFNTLLDQACEAGLSLFRRESKVRTACEHYKEAVDRETDLVLKKVLLESARALLSEYHV